MILYDTDRVSLVQAETLAFLRTLPDKCFDLVLTDPPYGDHVHAKLGKERRNDGISARDELTFPPMTPPLITEVARELVRLCKGWILIFSDFYTTAIWGEAIRAAGGAWVRTGQWVKTNPMPQMTGDRPACGAEDILIAHATGTGLEWNGKGHAAIWRGPRDRGGLHPNQKPEWLIQALLGMFAPPCAAVLDPYIGSGTTAVAALAKHRLVGEAPAETTCAKCAEKRSAEYAPPLPMGCRVLGVEGDPSTAAKAAQRIADAERALSIAC